MKTMVLLVICSLLAIASKGQGDEVTQKLTDGGIKRWIYSKSELSMGARIKTIGECPFKTITFNQTSKKYRAETCEGDNIVTGNFNVQAEGVEEYYVILNKVRYEVLFDKTFLNGKERSVLILRIAAVTKLEETKEYFYYGE